MLEDYVDAVYAALDDNKATIGLVEVHEEDTLETINIREASELPIAMVDGSRHRRTREDHIYKGMDVTITLLFDLGEGNYTPAVYKEAREAAWTMEELIGETYLRNIATWEEPETVESEGGLILIGNRKVYGILMNISTVSPVTS